MGIDLSKDIIWETYKYLSTNPVTEEELDVYYYLTNTYIDKENNDTFSQQLENLLCRATGEKVTASRAEISICINALRAKIEPV